MTTNVAAIPSTEVVLYQNPETLQSRVKPWMDVTFGPAISRDTMERNHRSVEEAIELAQANDCSLSEVLQLVYYVFSRERGEIKQEVGGVIITLAALCNARGIDMHECGDTELDRIWPLSEKIRLKQLAKPKHLPIEESLPQGANMKAEHLFAVLSSTFHSLNAALQSSDDAHLRTTITSVAESLSTLQAPVQHAAA